jgi:hypothetical protein
MILVDELRILMPVEERRSRSWRSEAASAVTAWREEHRRVAKGAAETNPTRTNPTTRNITSSVHNNRGGK